MPRQRQAAIIGAGVSGLNCARHLELAGWRVDVFDKSRGAGGRLAVKRLDGIGSVDLGAQFITVRTPELLELFQRAEADGAVGIWQARIAYLTEGASEQARAETRWIGTPGMNAWLESVWPRGRIHFNRLVERIDRQANGLWRLDGGSDEYDCVVLAMPPAQVLGLAPSAAFSERLQALSMHPCWAALALFDRPLAVDFDAAFVRVGGLDWMASNCTKPGRTQHTAAWTLHAGPDLSRQLLEEAPEVVGPRMLEALSHALHAYPRLPASHLAVVHRWRYAAPAHTEGPGVLWDPERALAACGDWSVGGRVEGAFTAGRELALRIAAAL